MRKTSVCDVWKTLFVVCFVEKSSKCFLTHWISLQVLYSCHLFIAIRIVHAKIKLANIVSINRL